MRYLLLIVAIVLALANAYQVYRAPVRRRPRGDEGEGEGEGEVTLVPCPHCGGFVHPDSARCPHCGRTLAPDRLALAVRTFLLTLLAVAIVGLLLYVSFWIALGVAAAMLVGWLVRQGKDLFRN